MSFEHVSPTATRAWASLDAAVGFLTLTPWGAKAFIALLYWGNGLLGGNGTAPDFGPVHLLFVCLMGALISVWAVARILHPSGLLAVIDGWARGYVGLMIAAFLVFSDVPSLLWLFVFTELAGAVAQLRAGYLSRR